MLGTLTGDSNTYTITLCALFKITWITLSERSKVIFRSIICVHAQVWHGTKQPMKLREFHKYDTIDIACSKKVTLSQSSNDKAITKRSKILYPPTHFTCRWPLMISNEIIGTLGTNIANIGEHCNPANLMHTKHSIVYSVLFMLHVFVQFLTIYKINRMVQGLAYSQWSLSGP